MSLFDQIVANGNRTLSLTKLRAGEGRTENNILCADGFKLSVIAGGGTYCTPRPDWFNDVPEDYPGPYSAVEVGYPSSRPEPWDEWSKYADGGDENGSDVYGYVPVELVRDLITAHGGEKS